MRQCFLITLYRSHTSSQRETWRLHGGTYEGTQAEQMGPFPPSGRKVRVDVGAVLRVENGKLAELWITWDNMTVLSQLGHLPAVPTAAA